MDNNYQAAPQQQGGGSSGSAGFIVIILLVVAVGAYFLWPKLSAALGSTASAAPVSPTTPAQAATIAANTASAEIPETAAGKLISSNPVSDEAVQLRISKKNEFGKFNTGKVKEDQYNAYWGQIISDFGDTRTEREIKDAAGINYNEALVTGFMKGMNIEQTKNNVIAWREYLKEYLEDERRLFHWDVKTVGQFLGKAKI